MSEVVSLLGESREAFQVEEKAGPMPAEAGAGKAIEADRPEPEFLGCHRHREID